jgi:hypothetical protein
MSKLKWRRGIMTEERELFYISIGQGISFWTGMESLLVQIAARLLGSTDIKAGLVLYSIANFYSWLTIIDDLFSLDPKFVSLKTDWGPIAEKLKGLNDIRVRLAHHTSWGDVKVDGRSALRPGMYDARSKSRKFPPLITTEIIDFSEKLRLVRVQMLDLLGKMEAVAPSAGPLHGTLFEQAADPDTPSWV